MSWKASLALFFPVSAGEGQVPLHHFHSEPSLHIGSLIAGIGDLDGDGVPDVAFGDPYAGVGGRVLVVSGASGTTLRLFQGDLLYEFFGVSIAPAGDMDGDGRADVLVGASAYFATAMLPGSAKVFSGGTGAVLHSWSGDATWDLFGSFVSGGGDVDGDGVPDCVVGAPYNDTAGTNAGQAKVFSGATGNLLYAWHGSAPGDSFGASVALLRDANGDGRADVAVGAYGSGGPFPAPGQVRLFSGATGGVLHTWNGAPGDGLGYPLAEAGDVDGDGLSDLVATAYYSGNHAGKVNVYSGGSGTLLYSWIDPSLGTYFGSSVSGAGDVNGDGRSDVIVGKDSFTSSTLNGQYGMAKVFSGANGSILHQWFGNAPALGLGSGVAAAGDLDGDGRPDLLVGVPGAGGVYPSIGEVRPMSGATGALLRTWTGTPANVQFGKAVAGVGDLDGDGRDDIAVGGPGPILSTSSTNLGREGRVRVISGATGAKLHGWSGVTGSLFGTSVGGCGDVNGDGTPDLIVGAPSLPSSSPVPSRATVFSGFDGSTLQTWTDASTSQFGASVSGTGDVDGDGRPDVAAGAPGSDEVRIFSGMTGAAIRTLMGPGGSFGAALANAGDVNGDGISDLVVGAPYHAGGGTNAGQARVFSGASGATLLSWNGAATGDEFGASVSGAGDLDHDGRADVVVGAPMSEAGGFDSGEATAFSGATGVPLFAWHGANSYERFGVSVGGGGDADGDGWPDLVIGVPGAAGTGSYGGQVKVFSGRSGTLLDTIDGSTYSGGLGAAVAFAGHVDAGACADFIVGEPYYGPTGNGSAYVYVSSLGGIHGYADLGHSLAGTNGVSPLLQGFGVLQPGNPITLAAHRVLPSAPGILVVGVAPAWASAFGGTLVPLPAVTLPGFSANASGGVSASFLLQAPAPPSGARVYAQALFADPGAPQEVSMTNALSIAFP